MKSQEPFGTVAVRMPKTQGVKYAGSKLKLLPHILDMVAGLDVQTVLDGFSGTTRVSQAFAKLGYRVVANDISVWSKTFAECYLLNRKPKEHFAPMIDHLNHVTPCYGWFTEHYSGLNGMKGVWQAANTMKLDAVRDEIDRMTSDPIEKSVLLTSLIMALDEVDSTLGHFVSYLKDWSPRSYKPLMLRIPMLINSKADHDVHYGDIFDCINDVTADLAYFDPPYGSNNEKMPPSRVRYASYYHLWTTVIMNDRPNIFGRASRREDSRDDVSVSVFEEFRTNDNGRFVAIDAIEQLLEQTRARYILLSYSSGGRATRQELLDGIERNGQLLATVSVDYKKNVMSGMRWTNQWIASDDGNEEYLLLMEKKGDVGC